MRIAYIMRGIPGSGKSTMARQLVEGTDPGKWAIHSTDHLCMVDGTYQFDPDLAGERHAQNLRNFKDSLIKGIHVVICDNTNVKQAQYTPYVVAAMEEGYRVAFVELPHPAPSVAAMRTIHEVPQDTINQMVLSWEPSQHCCTVDKVNEAVSVVTFMRASFGICVLAALVGGAIGGALLQAFFKVI